jgi:hypothetical protein
VEKNEVGNVQEDELPADLLGLVGRRLVSRRHHDEEGSLDSGEDLVLSLFDAEDLLDKDRSLFNAKGGTGPAPGPTSTT